MSANVQNLLANARNKKLFLICVSLAFGLLFFPLAKVNGEPVVFGPVIYQALISGFALGVAGTLLLDVIRGFGSDAKKDAA